MKNIIIEKDRLTELAISAYMAGHKGYADQAKDFVDNLIEDYLEETKVENTQSTVDFSKAPEVDYNDISLVDANADNGNLLNYEFSGSISDQTVIVTASDSHYDPVVYTTSEHTGVDSSTLTYQNEE